MAKVTIDRELLERINESAICDGTDATISDDLFVQLVAALDAQRGLTRYTIGIVGGISAFVSADDGCMVLYEDAQRAIAELREECAHLKGCQENAMLHLTGLVSERDTLRQQLADMTKRAKTAEREAGKALSTLKGLEKVAKVVSDNSDQVCGELNVMRQQRNRLAGALVATSKASSAAEVDLIVDAALAEVNK